MTSWVIGFDLSLSAPAAVALPTDWKPGDWKRVKAWLGKPPTPESQDDLHGQMRRYGYIAGWAVECIATLGSDVSGYVEAYGYSANNKNASRIQESGGVVKWMLWYKNRTILTPVTSSGARKLTLGFNPRRPTHDPKVVVQTTVFKFGAPKSWGENECDAFLIAQAGLSELGGTILALPPPKKATR
jgi:hypothetical protein